MTGSRARGRARARRPSGGALGAGPARARHQRTQTWRVVRAAGALIGDLADAHERRLQLAVVVEGEPWSKGQRSKRARTPAPAASANPARPPGGAAGGYP